MLVFRCVRVEEYRGCGLGYNGAFVLCTTVEDATEIEKKER